MADDSGITLDKTHRFKAGTLNPLNTDSTETFDSQRSDFFELLKTDIFDKRSPDIFKGSGPYKAIVLRVDETGGPKDTGLAAYYSMMMGTSTSLVKIKAYVDILHSHLPTPSGDGKVDGPHQAIIDMYPTYIAVDSETPAPSVGDVVWVDYQNASSFSGPMYMGPIVGGKTSVNANPGATQGASAAKPCNPGLQMTPPPGGTVKKLPPTAPSVKNKMHQADTPATQGEDKLEGQKPKSAPNPQQACATTPTSPAGQALDIPVTPVPGAVITGPVSGFSAKRGKAFGKAKWKTMCVMHDTATIKTAQKQYNSFMKIGGGYNYIVGRDGTVKNLHDPMARSAASNWANPFSFSISMVTPAGTYAVGRKKQKALAVERDKLGFIMVGKDSNIPSLKTPARIPWCDGGTFPLPSLMQVEAVYRVLSGLITNPPDPKFQVPNKYIAAINGEFIWGRFAGQLRMEVGKKGKVNAKTYWRGLDTSKPLTKGQEYRKGPQLEDRHYGIAAHGRWTHNDGYFGEYYCLGRSLGLASQDAYFATIAAIWLSGHTKKSAFHRGGRGANRSVTSQPNMKLAELGKKLYGNLPLSTYVKGQEKNDKLVNLANHLKEYPFAWAGPTSISNIWT